MAHARCWGLAECHARPQWRFRFVPRCLLRRGPFLLAQCLCAQWGHQGIMGHVSRDLEALVHGLFEFYFVVFGHSMFSIDIDLNFSQKF